MDELKLAVDRIDLHKLGDVPKNKGCRSTLTGSEKTTMTEAMKKVKQLTSNALAIVGAASKFVSMAGLYRVDSINVAEVRVNKLEENSEDEAVSFNPDNGMPTWLTEESRRHLKELVSTPKNNLKSVILSRIAAGLHRVVGALTNSSAK
ncbi:hypothetical protein HPP92_009328 [Vanilla planifolia]|uniref:Uncharacterized protein n=1 Tax=Vanilla planifolia TaxID=51239 RepID=A0A835RAE2_VANPL|nr:hypothetical protein HPP92_009328 [Vanilla planifolia]